MIKNIEEVFSDIESVRGSSDRVITGLKYNYYSYLNRVDVKKRMLEGSISELKTSRTASYDEIKTSVEKGVVELRLLLNQINNLFIKY